jgi:multidrug resistance efflux pump
MEVLLLGIYSFFVWLIFFKFKWLPWNIVSQVTVVTIPIVGLTATILLLNVGAPSTADVRVLKYVVNVNPQVRGRVIEVPVGEGNVRVKKGDVLFKLDPTPYEIAVRSLEAQLENAKGKGVKLSQELPAARGKTTDLEAQLRLANMRVKQYRDLAEKGAGDRFALEAAERDVRSLQAQIASARAGEAQVQAQLSATYRGDLAEIAAIQAQLDNAKWELEQTIVTAPADGWAINVQLRPGAITTAFPATAAVQLVEDEFQVIALYSQNELHQVRPGDEAEITLLTDPGLIIKAKVDSIVWANSQGQQALSAQLPTTGNAPLPPGRFPVKLDIDPKYHEAIFLAAGAVGDGAIYTHRFAAIHVIRKVILRVGAKLNYLILKLH